MREHIFVVMGPLNAQTQNSQVLVTDVIKQHLPPRDCECLPAPPYPQTKVDVNILEDRFLSALSVSTLDWGDGGAAQSKSP